MNDVVNSGSGLLFPHSMNVIYQGTTVNWIQFAAKSYAIKYCEMFARILERRRAHSSIKILDRVTEIFIFLTLFITICIEVYFYADDDEAIWIRLSQKWYCTKVRFMRWLMACCSWSLVSCLYPTDGTAVTGALLGIIGSSLSGQAASVAHRAATMCVISVKLIVDFSIWSICFF